MVDPLVGATLVAPLVVKTGEKAFEKGVSDAIESAKKLYKSESQRKKWDEELERTATVFHEKLQVAVSHIARENDDEHLEEVAENWDKIALELNEMNITYEAQEEVVDQICNAIEASFEQKLPAEYAKSGVLRRAIETAYAHSLHKFADEIEGTELAERLQHEVNRDVITELRQISDQLELIDRYLDRYEHFHEIDTRQHSEWQERASGTLAVDEYYQPYTPPSGLTAVADHQYLLVVGRAGTGKTRALLETLGEINTENLDRVIIPKRSFRTLADVEPLCNRNYEGDVLFLWDDIHKFADSNDGIKSVIQKLRTKVEDDGHNLWVRLTIRREEFDKVFEEQDRPERLSGEFWKGFETAEIDDPEYFTEERVDQLVDSAIKQYNIDANPRVRQKLVQQVVKTAPNPEYVDAICKTVRDETDGRLTAAYTDNLPEDALNAWIRRCEQLESKKPDYYRILKALWVVDRLDISLTAAPVKYLYTEWCDGKREFELGLKYLNSRGWVFVEKTNQVTRLQIHDFRLEAIDQSVPDFKGNERELKELSEALQDSALEWELSGDSERDLPAIVHANFAQFLAESFVYHDRFGARFQSMANTHFEKAIELSRETISVYASYAEYLERRGKLDRAHEIYEEALEEEATNTSIRRSFAQFLKEQGRVERAIDVFEEGLDHTYVEPPLRVWFAYILVEHGETERAAELYEEGLKHTPEETYLWERFASLLADQGEVKRAIEVYEEGLKHTPFLRRDFASLLADQGEVMRAIEMYEEDLDHTPGDTDLRRDFALFLAEQGEVGRAIEVYEEGLKHTPGDADLRRGFASLLANQGEAERAIEVYEESSKHILRHTAFGVRFISSLVEQGEGERASEVCEEGLEQAPEDTYLRERFASLLADQGKAERAIEVYEEGLKYTPEDTYLRERFASLLADQGKAERAIEVYEEGLKHTPSDTGFRTDFAILLANQGEIGRGIGVFEEGLDHTPGDTDLQVYFTSFLAELEEVERAIEVYEEGLDHTPTDKTLRFKYTSFLAEQGEIERAIEVYEEGLKHTPGDAMFRGKFAAFLTEQKETKKAIELYEDGLDQTPVAPFLRRDFASYLAEQGEVARAINEYETALDNGLSPTFMQICPISSCNMEFDCESLPDHLRNEHLS
ncbi:tetratricopeptide repeat protein [Natronosalvus vescus]|uniref:tetratricopeptide repeat protein n=1 Tax=Natronosalvus vescus TaxID=2953881 RepID=UPI0020901C0E|nr:tetratricopeptide repeat protein [Natronosalvus vescus]